MKSDEELVDGFKSGIRADFEIIVQRYRDRIFQYASWQCGSDDAEDAAQEVFLQLFRSAGSFEGRSRFSTWFFGIARHVCRGRQKSNRTKQFVHFDPRYQEIPDAAAGAQMLLERAESQAAVRRAVERLSPIHREVLQLREWEEMTYDEIAQVLDVPVGTVRSRLHNAREALGHILTPLSIWSER